MGVDAYTEPPHVEAGIGEHLHGVGYGLEDIELGGGFGVIVRQDGLVEEDQGGWRGWHVANPVFYSRTSRLINLLATGVLVRYTARTAAVTPR